MEVVDEWDKMNRTQIEEQVRRGLNPPIEKCVMESIREEVIGILMDFEHAVSEELYEWDRRFELITFIKQKLYEEALECISPYEE